MPDTHEEDGLRPVARGVRVALAQRDELLGQALGLFGLGPSGGDSLVFEERGDQVAQQGLSVGGAAVQVPVLEIAACHGARVELLKDRT